MVTIYILRLNDNKFYVDSEIEGESKEKKIECMDLNNIPNVIRKHIDGYGGEWTKKYTPISIYKVIKKSNKRDVNKYTKIMMSKYGIENVRGGAYNSIKLNEIDNLLLTNEITRGERCEDNWICNICDKEFDEEDELMEHIYYCKEKQNICYRCNKRGHYISECKGNTIREIY